MAVPIFWLMNEAEGVDDDRKFGNRSSTGRPVDVDKEASLSRILCGLNHRVVLKRVYDGLGNDAAR